eukprot:c25189_g1_i2 orf=522-1490(+)
MEDDKDQMEEYRNNTGIAGVYTREGETFSLVASKESMRDNEKARPDMEMASLDISKELSSGTDQPLISFKYAGCLNFVWGGYDWGFLCMPRLPFRGRSKPPPFYSKDEDISLVLALIMGLQHALAMVGGIVTAPLIISKTAGFSAKTESYSVSAALIVTSVASFIQILQIRIPFTKYVIGSGLLSVMGISFAYIPVAQNIIGNLKSCSCNGSPCEMNDSCNSCSQPLEGNCMTGEEAYGAILGTVLVVCWFETALSFASPKVIRRIFPPVVTGTCLILVGVSLVATGFELWGGGQSCASQVFLHYSARALTFAIIAMLFSNK